MRFPEHSVPHLIWEALRAPVSPHHRGYLAFGWMLLLMFTILVGSGSLLSLYYQASPESAAESVKFIARDVHFGWLVRGVHYWAGHAMVALCLLQFLRVFLAGSYKGPGRASWGIGLLLFFLVLAMAFSGEILTWDQESYWAMTAALSRIESIPLLGPVLASMLRGGAEVSATTLSRGYFIHVLFVPWLAFLLIVINLWLLTRRKGGSREGTP